MLPPSNDSLERIKISSHDTSGISGILIFGAHLMLFRVSRHWTQSTSGRLHFLISIFSRRKCNRAGSALVPFVEMTKGVYQYAT
jgi:hypothetical protein